MEENMEKSEGPLATLAGIADQFILFKPERLSTQVKIKLSSLDYMGLMREVENITNVGGNPDSKTFSIDIDNGNFYICKRLISIMFI